jgi:hypothetical protein
MVTCRHLVIGHDLEMSLVHPEHLLLQSARDHQILNHVKDWYICKLATQVVINRYER